MNLIFDFKSSSNTVITISWDPPFSLNLTTAEPDIQYCVDVYNVTGDDLVCNESAKLISNCSIASTRFAFFPHNLEVVDVCFVVTPSSNLQGSINGTSSIPAMGYLLSSELKLAVLHFQIM